MSSTGWVLSGFGAVVFAIAALGVLQFLFFVVSGGIPGTGYYYARRLRDGSASVRQEAVRDLVDRGDRFALDLLIKALDDRETAIRVSAIEGLGRFRNQATIEPLIKQLADKSLVIQIKAIETLSKLPGPTVTEALIKVLQEADSRAKLTALRYFKDQRDPEGLPAIAQMLTGHDDQLAQSASGVLRQFGPDAIPALAAVLPVAGSAAKHVVKSMIEIDALAAMPPLMGVFSSATDLHVLIEVLDAFIMYDLPGTVDFLVPFLEREGFPARSEVVQAIPYLRDPLSVAPLCRLLSDRDGHIRRLAATSLDKLVASCPDVEMIEPLCQALTDPDPEIQRFAAHALGGIGGRFVQQKIMRVLWGSQTEDNVAFIERIVGYSISRMVTFEEVALGLDRVMTNQRPTEDEMHAVDLIESLLIAMHGSYVRGHRVDEQTMDLLIRGRRTFYPLRLGRLHPLAASLLDFVVNKAEGDRWRATSIAP